MRYLDQAKRCSPRCDDFACAKRALRTDRGSNWCTWINEPCNPVTCTYALCMKKRLLPNGVCSISIRRKTTEKEQPDDILRNEIKVKSKVLRKTGEKSVFL